MHKMKNILYIPLDERPCNMDFIGLISQDTEYHIHIPYEKINGCKKRPTDVDALLEWIEANISQFDGAILSMDMLLYGGIVPSRIHKSSKTQLLQRLEIIKNLKKKNSRLKIYAFNLIMRCPSYSSSDEEPDYYETYGSDLFELGRLNHRASLQLLSDDEKAVQARLSKEIPEQILSDYTQRRALNLLVNQAVIDLLKDNEKAIDFLVIPQDDSAPYGFTAVDQKILREYIHSNRLAFKAYMYPGADEVGLTLFARFVNEDKACTPKFYTRYSSTKGPSILPLYEDRVINETLKWHILSSGGMLTDSLDNCDIVLMIHSPAEAMAEAWEQHEPKTNPSNRNLVEFVLFIDYVIHEKKLPCGIADVAYSNGGDLQLVDNLSTQGLLYKLSSYAAWNTNGNTLGTSICQSTLFKYYGCTASHKNFLALRYVEDSGYCSVVRQDITQNILPVRNLNYFEVDGTEGQISEIVAERLQEYADMALIDPEIKIHIQKCSMPWNRMFETKISLATKNIADN